MKINKKDKISILNFFILRYAQSSHSCNFNIFQGSRARWQRENFLRPLLHLTPNVYIKKIVGASIFTTSKQYSNCVFGNLILMNNFIYMCWQKNSFAVICTPIDKNTPIYGQKHIHCTFASLKNPCTQK